MKTKRNSFWTVVFSLVPGAGHMFMGFMKMGVSLMAAFFAVIAVSTWLNIAPFLYLLPILWCYSFFDCINRRFSSDEAFAAMGDHYLFSLDRPAALFAHSTHRHLIAGWLLVILGLYILLENLWSLFSNLLPSELYSGVYQAVRSLPQFLAALAIIVLGAWLIAGRRKGREEDA